MAVKSAVRRPKIRPGRLSAEDTALIEDRLLDAALALFIERGYADATMDQIAKRAGASTKTLYNRFANKAEIMEAVVDRNVQSTVANAARSFALQPRESDPRAFLVRFGVLVGDALNEETTGITRLTMAEAHRFPVLRRTYRETTGRGIDAITTALHEWRASGALTFNGDAAQLASLCFGMMTDGPRIRAIIGDPLTRAEMIRLVELAADLFLRGIRDGDLRAGEESRRKDRKNPERPRRGKSIS